jgi:hypothetical protein
MRTGGGVGSTSTSPRSLASRYSREARRYVRRNRPGDVALYQPEWLRLVWVRHVRDVAKGARDDIWAPHRSKAVLGEPSSICHCKPGWVRWDRRFFSCDSPAMSAERRVVIGVGGCGSSGVAASPRNSRTRRALGRWWQFARRTAIDGLLVGATSWAPRLVPAVAHDRAGMARCRSRVAGARGRRCRDRGQGHPGTGPSPPLVSR